MRIGLIGCGAIGTVLAEAIEEIEKVEALYVWDVKRNREERLLKFSKVQRADLDQIVDSCDLVVEASSQQVVRDYVPIILENGLDVLIMSVGALASKDLFERINSAAVRTGSHIHVPSGAICGIDGVKAVKRYGIEKVSLKTTKSPNSITPPEGYLEGMGIDLAEITEPTVIFKGNAADAVKLFPKNINVAATLAIAGIGFERTAVEIVVDPDTKRNRHEVRVEGEFGGFTAVTENVPSPKNPQTSFLAALAAIAKLREMVDNFHIGT